MSALDFVQMLVGSGVLAQGAAMLRWAMRMEVRVSVLEARQEEP